MSKPKNHPRAFRFGLALSASKPDHGDFKSKFRRAQAKLELITFANSTETITV